jgi:hypothetical protein
VYFIHIHHHFLRRKDNTFLLYQPNFSDVLSGLIPLTTQETILEVVPRNKKSVWGNSAQ